MKKRNIWTRPTLLLSVSAVLLLMSTVGSTRAALTYYSANYAVQVEVDSIGVSLMENGEIVSYRNYDDKAEDGFVGNEAPGTLLEGRFEGDSAEKLVPEKKYDEILEVANSGAIDEYVRVIITKSWKKPITDDNGETIWVKDTELTPDLIHLDLEEQALKNGWLMDTRAAGTDHERTVLYYSRPIISGGVSTRICEKLWLDSSLMDEFETESSDDGTVTVTYKYNGYRFELEAEVDAVQTHNAVDAIKSAWGVDVDIAPDKTLSLR